MSKALTYVEIDVPEFAAVDRAANFDGATWLTRGGTLTGAADSGIFSFSMWVEPEDVGNGNVEHFVSFSGTGSPDETQFALFKDANDCFSILGRNAAGATILSITCADPLEDSEPQHICGCVDLSDADKCFVFIDDQQADLTVTTYTIGGTIDLATTDCRIGAAVSGLLTYTGNMADVWFEDGVYIDFSQEENRRLFIDDMGGPTTLESDGSGPTGSAPLIFLSGALATWHTNKGTGGGFTVTAGALGDAGYLLETYRFAMPTDYLPADIECIPSLDSVSVNPALVSLGKDLGQRAAITATLSDHRHVMNGEPYDQGTFFGKWRGRYMTKLRGRSFRIIRGMVGQDISAMDTRHYVIDSVDGPTFNGKYTIQAKDILKLADEDRAQAPVLSNGSLAGSINAVTTSATLSPAGIGDLEYPASGWVCLGGKEVCAFTRVGNALTITRGQFGTVASTHDAGDRIQLVLRYTGDDAADIIRDLLVNYADVPAAYIDLDAWQAETAEFLSVIYARTITEPMAVNKLVSELIEQAALAVWWDDRAKQIRLQVLREIATDAATFGHEDFIDGSFSVKEQPNRRISQMWTYYGQRDPTDSGANEDNYRAVLATVDLESQAEYGSAEIAKIQGAWLETETAASRLNSIQLSRFVDPPRSFAFDLFRDASVVLGSGYKVNWWGNQTAEGLEVPAEIQVTKVSLFPDRVHVEAEEMLAFGVVVLVNVVFLTTTGGVFTWEVPATWNDADNTVETIGGGGAGSTNSGSGGAGGGGGAYSKVSNLNLTPLALVSYRVGAGGTPGVDGGDTWFNGASLAASSVGAKGGTSGVGRTTEGIGGQASAGIGDVKTSGGNGGTGGDGGGGAGGAGGPNGNGKTGGSVSDTGDSGGGGGGADGGSAGAPPTGGHGGAGGNNRFNFGGGAPGESGDEGGGGGGGTDNESAGGPGGDGEQIWTQTVAPIISAGPGGGGGGGSKNVGGAAGGLYGGGGGGAGQGGLAGDGGQGIIVIRWREA